jgi:hypothetical protein
MVMIYILFSPHRLQLADAVQNAGLFPAPRKAAQYSGPKNQFNPFSSA